MEGVAKDGTWRGVGRHERSLKPVRDRPDQITVYRQPPNSKFYCLLPMDGCDVDDNLPKYPEPESLWQVPDIDERISAQLNSMRASIQDDIYAQRDFVSSVTRFFCIIGLALGSGAITLFGCDLWCFLAKEPLFQMVSTMPWTAAGLASSIAISTQLIYLLATTES